MNSQFYRWLKKQDGRDDPVGDFAMDVLRDLDFPMKTTSHKKIEQYLECCACDEALAAFRYAHAEFKCDCPSKPRAGISLSLRFDILKRGEFRCNLCGADASTGTTLEVDHIVPVAKGGSDDPDNLWTLCFECNRGKGIKDLS